MNHLDAEKLEILEKTQNYQQRIEELKEDLLDKEHEIVLSNYSFFMV
jgi:hypothetical protein